VVLRISHFGHGSVLFADCAEEPEGGPPPSPDGNMLAGMIERFPYVVANESGTAHDVDYMMWIFRESAAPSLDQEDTALAQILVAQIARILDLASRLDSSTAEKALYSETLERLNIGVIMVGAGARILSASPVAQRFLAARNGIQIQAGKLRATSTAEDRELQSTIRTALDEVAGAPVSRGLALTKSCGARTLGIMVRPGASPAAGSIAIYVRDCELVPGVQSEFVGQIFDLTPAEAAVTHRLTVGLSLEDTATSLSISRNTARAHLRSIFSKSGITRQTELVRLVLNSAVILGERPDCAA
jgi:DNA-binding CsgD family transcriptional regulator